MCALSAAQRFDSRSRSIFATITTPWSFYTWGIDLVGKIHPPSLDGHNFIIVATEYFTKWVEVIPLTLTTGAQVSKFILYHIIFH